MPDPAFERQPGESRIAPLSTVPDGSELPTNVLTRLSHAATRHAAIADGAVSLAKAHVDAHRARFATFQQTFQPAFLDSLSKLPLSPIEPNRVVKPGESTFTKSTAAIQKTIRETVNSDDPQKRAPARGFISLTAGDVTKLKAAAGPDGTVPASAIEAVAAGNGAGSTTTTYVQSAGRLPLCQPATPNVADE